MFDTTYFEFKRDLRGKMILTVLLIIFALGMVALYPSFSQSGLNLDAYIESFPPQLKNVMLRGITSLTSIEGFLVAEVYQWLWVLLLGIYQAYSASSLITEEVEKGSIDLLLANPISRVNVVVQKFLSVIPSIVILNILTPVAIYFGVQGIGESIALESLFRVHLVSISYFLACASTGLLLSVIFDEVKKAQNVSIGLIFIMYVFDSLTVGTDLSWIGKITFSRYFVPGEILMGNEIDWIGVTVLLLSTIILVSISAIIFRNKDL